MLRWCWGGQTIKGEGKDKFVRNFYILYDALYLYHIAAYFYHHIIFYFFFLTSFTLICPVPFVSSLLEFLWRYPILLQLLLLLYPHSLGFNMIIPFILDYSTILNNMIHILPFLTFIYFSLLGYQWRSPKRGR